MLIKNTFLYIFIMFYLFIYKCYKIIQNKSIIETVHNNMVKYKKVLKEAKKKIVLSVPINV